jgi:hypothetical protein
MPIVVATLCTSVGCAIAESHLAPKRRIEAERGRKCLPSNRRFSNAAISSAPSDLCVFTLMPKVGSPPHTNLRCRQDEL